MRIISGIHRGRNINPPKNLPVRPTTDFAKESLFNIFNNNFDYEELAVLDLFSGTGGITYEFSSRGTENITAVDSNFKCFSFIKKVTEDLNMRGVHVFKSDVFTFLNKTKQKFDIIFADPPYELAEIPNIPDTVFRNNLLKDNGWLIVEHSIKTDLSEKPFFKEKRTYGNVNFSIFVNSKQE